MKKIYISGQITGLERDKYTFLFRMAIKRVFQETDCFLEEIINPFDLKPFLGIKSWLCYMITDVHYLRKCTHIAMQKNWIHSKGAIIEYFIAKFILKLDVIWL